MLKDKKLLLVPVGSVMRKDDYLPMTSSDKVDHNVYDTMAFISVHTSMRQAGGWTLCAPLFMAPNGGERPAFEDEIFPTFTHALMQAIELAVKYETFVVIVDDPITGKTMQPSREYPQVQIKYS